MDTWYRAFWGMLGGEYEYRVTAEWWFWTSGMVTSGGRWCTLSQYSCDILFI